MKKNTFIIITIAFTLFLFVKCQKYETHKYTENKVKYLIFGTDTSEFFYDYQDRITKIKKRWYGVYEEIVYQYKTDYILEKDIIYNDSIPEQIEEVYEAKLITDEYGYVIEERKHYGTNYFEYDENHYLIKKTPYGGGVVSYEIQSGNITKVFNSNTIFYYEYGDKNNNIFRDGGISYNTIYGKKPANNITKMYVYNTVDNTFEYEIYYNFIYDDKNRLIRIEDTSPSSLEFDIRCKIVYY